MIPVLSIMVQKHITSYIKDNLSKVTSLLYFSDGASSQYKNYKNFINLCYHKDDFGIDLEWGFFGTSQGKSPCDGIGGSVKILTRNASLKRSYLNHNFDSRLHV